MGNTLRHICGASKEVTDNDDRPVERRNESKRKYKKDKKRKKWSNGKLVSLKDGSNEARPDGKHEISAEEESEDINESHGNLQEEPSENVEPMEKAKEDSNMSKAIKVGNRLRRSLRHMCGSQVAKDVSDDDRDRPIDRPKETKKKSKMRKISRKWRNGKLSSIKEDNNELHYNRECALPTGDGTKSNDNLEVKQSEVSVGPLKEASEESMDIDGSTHEDLHVKQSKESIELLEEEQDKDLHIEHDGSTLETTRDEQSEKSLHYARESIIVPEERRDQALDEILSNLSQASDSLIGNRHENNQETVEGLIEELTKKGSVSVDSKYTPTILELATETLTISPTIDSNIGSQNTPDIPTSNTIALNEEGVDKDSTEVVINTEETFIELECIPDLSDCLPEDSGFDSSQENVLVPNTPSVDVQITSPSLNSLELPVFNNLPANSENVHVNGSEKCHIVAEQQYVPLSERIIGLTKPDHHPSQQDNDIEVETNKSCDIIVQSSDGDKEYYSIIDVEIKNNLDDVEDNDDNASVFQEIFVTKEIVVECPTERVHEQLEVEYMFHPSAFDIELESVDVPESCINSKERERTISNCSLPEKKSSVHLETSNGDIHKRDINITNRTEKVDLDDHSAVGYTISTSLPKTVDSTTCCLNHNVNNLIDNTSKKPINNTTNNPTNDIKNDSSDTTINEITNINNNPINDTTNHIIIVLDDGPDIDEMIHVLDSELKNLNQAVDKLYSSDSCEDITEIKIDESCDTRSCGTSEHSNAGCTFHEINDVTDLHYNDFSHSECYSDTTSIQEIQIFSPIKPYNSSTRRTSTIKFADGPILECRSNASPTENGGSMNNVDTTLKLLEGAINNDHVQDEYVDLLCSSISCVLGDDEEDKVDDTKSNSYRSLHSSHEESSVHKSFQLSREVINWVGAHFQSDESIHHDDMVEDNIIEEIVEEIVVPMDKNGVHTPHIISHTMFKSNKYPVRNTDLVRTVNVSVEDITEEDEWVEASMHDDDDMTQTFLIKSLNDTNEASDVLSPLGSPPLRCHSPPFNINMEPDHNTLDYGKYVFIDPSTGDIQMMRNRSRSLDSLVSMASSRSSISRFGSFEFVTDFEINIAEKNQELMKGN